FDRFVSSCYFMNRDNPRMRDAPLETMKRMIGDAKTRRRGLLRPQSEFVTDEDGRLLVDQVCRFEALQADFDRLCERLRLPASRLPRINVTDQEPHPCQIDRELQEAVADVYRGDFDLFEYDRDLPANLQPDSHAANLDVC